MLGNRDPRDLLRGPVLATLPTVAAFERSLQRLSEGAQSDLLAVAERVATHEFDLVVEGTAHEVNDPSTVSAMAARWAAEGWPARVDESGVALTAEFSAPSAGPPPWFVYRMSTRSATALGTTALGGATRWRF